MDYQHLASEVHKIAVMLGNKGHSLPQTYTQKRPLQPGERQSINDTAKDSLLKLMKTGYDMANIFLYLKYSVFADILNKLSLYMCRKLLESSEITCFCHFHVDNFCLDLS